MNYFIITGVSRGLGEALTQKLVDKENHIFCISRKRNDKLIALAENRGAVLEYFEFDLSNVSVINELMNNVFTKINKEIINSIYLINNAGIVSPIKPIEKCKSQEVISNISVNLIAPMLLTSLFIKYTEKFNVTKRIINISSGAGKKPYFGWSNYCSAKAGLDLFTQCVGLEQINSEFPVDIVSFAPGIIDTDMQQEIRNTKEEDFTQIQRFINFKKNNQLKSPDFVADIILEMVKRSEPYQGGIKDISEFLG